MNGTPEMHHRCSALQSIKVQTSKRVERQRGSGAETQQQIQSQRSRDPEKQNKEKIQRKFRGGERFREGRI